MKNSLIFGFICLILASCGTKELSREQAFQMLNQEMQYPKAYDFDIFRSDPNHAKKVLDAGLENDDFLIVKKTQKIVDMGNPLIEFTEKAKPYLLSTPEEDHLLDVQKVKIADEELVEVTDIKYGDEGKSAVVEYTTAYKNLTPFAVLVQTDLNKQPIHTAYFSLHDDGWKLERKK